jgi:hypothetical protein
VRSPRSARRGDRLRRLIAGTAGALIVLYGVPAHAAAETSTAEQAQAQAARAADDIAELQPRIDAAFAAYEQSLDDIARRVVRSSDADERADEANRQARAVERARVNSVRAVYMSGGELGVYATVLESRSAPDLMRRLAYARSVLRTTGLRDEHARATADRLSADAARLDAAVDRHLTRAADVQVRWQALTALLDQAQARLATLDARAGELAEAESGVAALRAVAAAAAAATTTAAGSVRAVPPPADYLRLYQSAATTCPGLSWTVLSAVGQVETAHGANASTSYAGAQGPMQFMPATFAAYGVDGDGDGDKDVHDPADAIYSAAAYLCTSGVGEGPDGLRRALFAYNRAQWYVDLVLSIAADLAG